MLHLQSPVVEGHSCVISSSEVRKLKTLQRRAGKRGTVPLGVYEAERVVDFVGHVAGVRRFQEQSTYWLVDRRGAQTRLSRDVSAKPLFGHH